MLNLPDQFADRQANLFLGRQQDRAGKRFRTVRPVPFVINTCDIRTVRMVVPDSEKEVFETVRRIADQCPWSSFRQRIHVGQGTRSVQCGRDSGFAACWVQAEAI